MLNTEPNFNYDLGRGLEGEQVILKRYKCSKSKDLRYDLISPKGRTWEVKSDYYDMTKYPNFFMEYRSNKLKDTLGGPWRALNDGVELFSYLFVKNRKHYIWETETLVNKLEHILETMNLNLVERENKNDGNPYYTTGYKIPRKLLEHCCLRIDTIEEKFFNES
tara:strand:+ start:238 stop:729 length:492 start_codon:yes stop_codon:yes gene_type:complete